MTITTGGSRKYAGLASTLKSRVQKNFATAPNDTKARTFHHFHGSLLKKPLLQVQIPLNLFCLMF